jgi:hypothetical protein
MSEVGLLPTRFALTAGLLAVVLGCSPDFAAPNELRTLRVLGVKKDDPYARPNPTAASAGTSDYQPDNVVDMTLGWDDAREVSARSGPIERRWFAGCENPAGDSYFACQLGVWLAFRAYEELGPSSLSDGETWKVGDADQAGRASLLESVAPSVPEAVRAAYLPTLDMLTVGAGDQFSLPVSPTIIQRHEPPADPDMAPYGVSYVFFTVCDGRLGIAEPWRGEVDVSAIVADATRGFPLACYDRDTGEVRGPDDYVAGFSVVYAFDELVNRNPVARGFEIDGQAVPEKDLCIGETCRHDADASAAADDVCGDPEAIHVARCATKGGGACPSLEVTVVVDESENSEVDTGASMVEKGGSELLEQMWIRYYTDAGQLDRVVRRLQDATLGWFDGHEAKWTVPKSRGQAILWSVVYDNRGGMDWVRARVCVD